MVKALRNGALSYADRGWKVIPLHPRSKAPLGKLPSGQLLVPNGKDDATSDLVTVFRWWRAAPAANIGIVCGASGFVALDVDPRSGGDEDLFELERELGELPETVRQLSGGGGEHYLFNHPGGELQGHAWPATPRTALDPKGKVRRVSGVDVKDRGYILAEPSIHPDTRREYAWDLSPDDVPIADLPAAWLDRLRVPPHLVREGERELNTNHDDPLRNVSASRYVQTLTGRDVERGGWVRCPFHGGGQETQPSFQCSGVLWACFGGCSAQAGKRVAGGNIYDFAAWLWDYPTPLRGADFPEVKGRLAALLGVTS